MFLVCNILNYDIHKSFWEFDLLKNDKRLEKPSYDLLSHLNWAETLKTVLQLKAELMYMMIRDSSLSSAIQLVLSKIQ